MNCKVNLSSLQQERSDWLLNTALGQLSLRMYHSALMLSRVFQVLICTNISHLNIFSKSFLDKVGRQGLYNMVANFDDKSAYAQCIYAFCESADSEPQLFVGKCDGEIVPPQGENQFGWDPIFKPKGY
jgi:hypothetical protein